MKKKVCKNLSSTSSNFSLKRFVYRNICKLEVMQSNHNSPLPQFRSLSSQARASPDYLRFAFSSESPKTVLKPVMNSENLLWASDLN